MQENIQASGQERADDRIEEYVNDFMLRPLLNIPEPPFDMSTNRPPLKPVFTIIPVLKATLPTSLEASRSSSTAPLPNDKIADIANYQVIRADQELREQFDLPLGLADARVSMVIINPAAFDYPRALVREIRQTLNTGDEEKGRNIVRSAVSRMWQVDANELSRCPIPDDLEQLYHENRRWAENNRAFFSSPPIQSDVSEDSEAMQAHKWDSPIVVVLGILPAMDKLDRELFAYEALLKSYVEPLKNAAGGQKHMTPAEYWQAYTEYLNNRLQTPCSTPEPLPPGDYNLRLRSRNELRDTRLKCLNAYTGINRVRATEWDTLADCQPFFFRMAQVLLTKIGTGFGSLATDSIMLADPGMAKLRESLLATADRVMVDEIVDSGLALCSMTKTALKDERGCEVLYQKHPDAELAVALFENFPEPLGLQHYQTLSPRENSGFLLQPPKTSPEYESWPSLLELSAVPPIGGLMEKRQGALIDIDKERLEERMRAYFDPKVTWQSLSAMNTGLTVPQKRFDPKTVRDDALRFSGFSKDHLQPYTFKPFDNRWCYHTTVKSLWGEAKPNLAALVAQDNQFLVVRSGKVVAEEGVPFFFTTLLGDTDVLRGHSYYFPVWVRRDSQTNCANLSEWATAYLAALGILPDNRPIDAARMLWSHVLAMGFAPAYKLENSEGIDQGWPRVPFPGGQYADAEANAKALHVLEESARLGDAVAKLLNLADDVDGVTCGEVRSELMNMALTPWDAADDAAHAHDAVSNVPVTMNWGKLSKENAVLPSHGRLHARDYTAEEKRKLEVGAWAQGIHAGCTYLCLGDETFDIHLNEKVYIKNIPAKVWRFTIGGYPVLKKWLSYREESILCRPLSRLEVDAFCQIARRIAALLLMGPRLNRNYALARDLHLSEKMPKIATKSRSQ